MSTELALEKGTRVKKGFSNIRLINTGVTLALMFLFGYLPPLPGVTTVGMKILGIFIGVMYGWTTVEIAWPSLAAIIAFGTSGYTSMAAAITSMMGHNVVFQCIVAFLSVGALTYYGFGKWFVRWSLSLPLFRGRPIFYVWSFMVFFGLSAFFINQIQLQIILYLIWVDITTSCGYSKDSEFLYAGMAGILLATIVGGAMIPYTSWQLGLAMQWASLTKVPFNMGLMGAITVPSTIITVTLYVLSLKYIFKIDFDTMERFDVEKLGDESKILRPRLKRILTVCLITVFVVILGNTLTNSWISNLVNNNLTVAGVYCVAATVLMIIPSGENDGKAAVVFQDVYKDVINWNVIFMVAVALVVAGAVTAPEVGVVEWISKVLAPVFAGKSSAYLITFAIVSALLLTNLGPCIASGTTMIAIIVPFVLESGTNPLLAGSAVIFAANIGMVLPGASAPAAIFHSNAALPDAKRRIKYSLFGCICFMVTAILVFSLLTLIF
ncbi:MAG: SLC13 family permease [Firmicutes bacterium]|nr:SLC13 family permease [Bacillota bacterium]